MGILKTSILIMVVIITMCFNNREIKAKSLSIQGYDVVAYFTKGKAVRGEGKYEYEWKGKRWLFSNEQNKQLFIKDSKKYIPQYGTYCAYAVSKGYLAKVDPEAWTIYKDKLYLNYSIGVKKRWDREKEKLIKQGDNQWKIINPNKGKEEEKIKNE